MEKVRFGGRTAWLLLLAVPLMTVASTMLLWRTAEARHRRDVTRAVFNDNMELLEDVRRQVGASEDSLLRVRTVDLGASAPYLVISIAENRLWYKHGDSVLFETRVATGSGKVLEKSGGGDTHWKFETPRGRLLVQRKDIEPQWVPPDWHFVEFGRKRGLGVHQLKRGEPLPVGDGSVVTVAGNDVVRRFPDGRTTPYVVGDEGREIVAGGNVIIPPFGTNQRKYPNVLGTRRLYLGDGYALHGTNRPETIGQSVSHGCVRLRNEDIERLFGMVPVGTPVYIY